MSDVASIGMFVGVVLAIVFVAAFCFGGASKSADEQAREMLEKRKDETSRP